MSDVDFPSGPWTGYYTYNHSAERGRMELDLKFTDGLVSGSGIDPVGFFVIRGRYDAQNAECWWNKSYPGRHTVYYRGFREGNGIWGVWDIRNELHGGFRIWPKGIGEGAAESVEEEVPVDAIGR